MEPIWKGKQTNKTSNMCTSDKGKQTNKQTSRGSTCRGTDAGGSAELHNMQSLICNASEYMEELRRCIGKVWSSMPQGHTLTASWHSESHSPVPVASHSAQSHLMAPYNISHNKSWHLLNKHGTDLIQIWQADYHDTKVHFGQKKKKKKK